MVKYSSFYTDEIKPYHICQQNTVSNIGSQHKTEHPPPLSLSEVNIEWDEKKVVCSSMQCDGHLCSNYQTNEVFSITNTIYMENKYSEFILDEDKFLRLQKILKFSVELLVPSSSKYVTAALPNHRFKNQACNMAMKT